MGQDLLLEIHCEEIPAKYLKPLQEQLYRDLGTALLKQQLIKELAPQGPSEDFYAPCKLAVRFHGLQERQPSVVNQHVGPAESICLTTSGEPTEAGLRFAQKWDLPFGEVRFESVAGKKGRYAVVSRQSESQSASAVLANIIPEVISSLTVPKAMRWGSSSFLFVRPIRNVLCLLGSDVVSFALDGVSSSRETLGHRLSPGRITIDTPSTYEVQLKSKNVIISFSQRRSAIKKALESQSAAHGAQWIEDEALLDTVAGIVEYPTVVEGSFPEQFLKLPRPVLLTSLREHQKAFCVEKNKELLPLFLTVANHPLDVPQAKETIRRGNEWVLKARLFDAEFFYTKDLASPLAQRKTALASLVFLRGGGSYVDKTERMKALAPVLGKALGLDGERCVVLAEYSKLDLVTLMVKEFPELQGVMGSLYLAHEGQASWLVQGVADHYLPLGPDSPLPQTDEGKSLGVIDKLDTIVAAFLLGLTPTGSKDPLALRRSGLGLIRILMDMKASVSLQHLVEASLGTFTSAPKDLKVMTSGIVGFLQDRFVYVLGLKGFAPSVVQASLAHEGDTLSSINDRCSLLQELRSEPAYQSLFDNAKRIENMLGEHSINPALSFAEYLTQPAEKNLHQHAERLITMDAIKTPREYCAHLLELSPMLDAFFDSVMILDSDSNIRSARLGLLSRVQSSYRRIGHLSLLSS